MGAVDGKCYLDHAAWSDGSDDELYAWLLMTLEAAAYGGFAEGGLIGVMGNRADPTDMPFVGSMAYATGTMLRAAARGGRTTPRENGQQQPALVTGTAFAGRPVPPTAPGDLRPDPGRKSDFRLGSGRKPSDPARNGGICHVIRGRADLEHPPLDPPLHRRWRRSRAPTARCRSRESTTCLTGPSTSTSKTRQIPEGTASSTP